MNECECEECGVDLRTESDPDGTGNFVEKFGWVCDDCQETIEEDENNA